MTTTTLAGAALDLHRTTDRNPVDRVRTGGDGGCPTPIRITAEAVDTGTGEMRQLDRDAVDLDCGRWQCPHCGPQNQRRWTAHLVDAMAMMAGLRFVTLTIDPKCGVSAADSRAYVVSVWSKFRKRLARAAARTGDRVAFAASIEAQRSGMAHIHAVLSVPGVDAEAMAAHWFACGGGVVVDVQAIAGDTREVARRVGYVVKYCLKDAQSTTRTHGTRHLLTSQGLGYHSEAAKAVRTAHVQAMLSETNENGEGTEKGEGVEPDGLRPGEVRVWTTAARRGGGSVPDPDAPTPDQLERWSKLQLDKRSTSYRFKGDDGIWYLITQHADGTRTKEAQPGYRSLYERRTEDGEPDEM